MISSGVHLSKSARRKRRRRDEHCSTYMLAVQYAIEIQRVNRVNDRDTKRNIEAQTKRLLVDQKRLIYIQQLRNGSNLYHNN